MIRREMEVRSDENKLEENGWDAKPISETFGGTGRSVSRERGRLVRDLVHLLDDELDGLATFLSIAVDLVGHEALQIVDERHVAHRDLCLLTQQRFARVLRMHRVCELFVDVNDVAECEIARTQRQLFAFEIDARVLACIARSISSDKFCYPRCETPVRSQESMGFNERSLGIDHSFDNVDTNNAWIQRVRVLLHCRFHHILP